MFFSRMYLAHTRASFCRGSHGQPFRVAKQHRRLFRDEGRGTTPGSEARRLEFNSWNLTAGRRAGEYTTRGGNARNPIDGFAFSAPPSFPPAWARKTRMSSSPWRAMRPPCLYTRGMPPPSLTAAAPASLLPTPLARLQEGGGLKECIKTPDRYACASTISFGYYIRW